MKYSERTELIASLREFADWLDDNPRKAIALPSMFINVSTYVTEYHKIPGSSYKDYGNPDEFTTRLKMRKIAKALAPCDKDYSGAQFTLKRKFGSISVKFHTMRDAVCERKVVGTREVPAYTIEARTEEVVEWSCNDSLLA